MNNVLQVKNLNRSYHDIWPWSKSQEVLTNVNMEIEPGTITGLLGKNGSGKTTLMNCALGLLKPDAGVCNNFGVDSWNAPANIRQRIGFVSQTYSSYQWMTVEQVSHYWSLYYENWDKTLAENIINQLELPKDKPIVKFSEGQKQKTSLVLGMSHRPDLLVLDEPVSSLDPVARRTFMQILLDHYMDETKTVLFSTHITSDLDRIASHIALLKGGEISMQTSLDELKQNIVRIRIHDEVNLESILDAIPCKLSQSQSGADALVTVSNVDEKSLEGIGDVRVEHLNLEEIFLEIYK